VILLKLKQNNLQTQEINSDIKSELYILWKLWKPTIWRFVHYTTVWGTRVEQQFAQWMHYSTGENWIT